MKLAKAYDYEIRQVSYSGFPDQVRGSREKMLQSFELALIFYKLSVCTPLVLGLRSLNSNNVH